MYGYYSDPSLLDIDFHENGKYIFPGTGFPDEIGENEAKGLKLNIPLLPGTGDEAYLKAFHKLVPDVVRRFQPEMILVQCGADRSEEHTSELQSPYDLVCRLLLEKKNNKK